MMHVSSPAPPAPLLSAPAPRPASTSAGARAASNLVRPPEVLFVCGHDAGRSQMGAALLDHHSQGRIWARSAVATPAAVAPPVVAAMAEIGIELSGACQSTLTDDAVRAASVVISMDGDMDGEDAVPFFPDTRYLTWNVEDPADLGLEAVRSIRDEIDARVRSLVYRLGVAARVGLLGEQAPLGRRSGAPDTPALLRPARAPRRG